MIVPPARKTCTCKNRYCSSHWQVAVAAWQAMVAAGGIDCWRCGQPIQPDEPVDGGHDDHDPNIWRGPEHVKCNRSTSTRRAARVAKHWTL